MAQLQLGLLVLARISAFMVAGPLFSLRDVPPLVKAGISVAVTMLLTPIVPGPVLTSSAAGFGLLVVLEVLVGLTLGYVASLILQAMKVAGQFIDLQSGLAMADLLDPESGMGVSLMGEFFYLLGLLMLLLMDGHLGMLRSLADSFQLLPPGTAVWQVSTGEEIVRLFSGMFALAFRLAAPLVVVLLVSDVALALVARVVPQLNVFILGMPLKAGLTLIMVIVLLPLLAQAFAQVLSSIQRDITLICHYMTSP